jgi:D-apiose dehydrogenase
MKGVGIGAGYFARFHYEAWSRIPEVEMAAVCDLSDEKARAMAAEYGIARVYTDWREMLDRERPDFMDIVTPPPTHEEIAAAAGERGIHIICQKPLAPDYETARRMVENAQRAGVRFMVHENFRWQPWYRKAKEIQRAGTIGEFTHIAFRMRTGDGWGENAYLDRQPFFRDYPRLLVFETAVHFIDTFRFLLGEVTEVFANLRRLNPVIRGEDTGQLFLRFDTGATALFDANRYNETESPRPRFTFGEFRIDGMGGHLTMDTESNLRMKPLGAPGEDVEYEREDVNFASDCVYALERHFVECMQSGAQFESNGEDYLKTVRVVDAAYESAERGQVVRL